MNITLHSIKGVLTLDTLAADIVLCTMKITLSVVVLFISMLTPGIESRDEEGTESQCSSNFNELVKQITASDKNRYNLQRAFFPPERESAIFVAITYSYENAPDNTSVWYWSVSTYYIYFPSKVLPWISLLFIEPSSRHSAINITLSEECLGADDDMMQLLTQRVGGLYFNHVCIFSDNIK